MIFEKLKKVISETLGVDENKVTMETNLIDDLGADSIDAVELIFAIEEAFSIKIEDEEAQNISTVEAIIKIIESKK